MLKLFIGTLSSLLLLVAGIVIFYWRDIQYDPTGADLLNYLLLFPLILCVILWSPVFIYHGIKAHQKRKEQQKQAQVEQHQDDENQDENQQAEAVEVQWLNLNIYSSSAYSAFGENDEILDEIKKFKSPELDTHF
jgi:flagellar biosynthesis component FlhA